MKFFLNPACLSAAFTLPTAVCDSHLKLAKSEHIKVIIYIFRNLAEGIDAEKIADGTGVNEYDVKEALLYWADAGILIPENTNTEPNKKNLKESLPKAEKPDRMDVAKRGNEDIKIKYLLNETQMKLGRNLKTNEMSTLVWLYDDLGLEVSIILLIVQYAVTHGKANIRFIEQTAVRWVDKGIADMSDAEEELRILSEEEQAWKVVSQCFGLERRKPSVKETEYSHRWIFEWNFSPDLLSAAYDECVNAKSKFSFSYVAKIIENWHKKGIKSPEEITKDQKPKEKDDFAAFDLDLYEKMINSKD